LIPAAVLVSVIGLAFGSFLNVVIYRLPRRQSLVWPGSACPSCGKAIRWYDNVPLIGWVALGGRCRDCGAPISVRYPIVEAITAAAFLICFWVIGPQWLLLSRLLFVAMLIALFAIDLEHQLLPDRITLPGIVVGLLLSIWLPPGLRDAFLGLLLGGGVLFALGETYFRFRGIEGMGFGDVKMLAMVGAFLGWKLVIVTFVLSSLVGGLFAMVLLLSRRTTLTSALPFGTFLAMGAFIASLWGEWLMNWYLSLYL
jgi:leader peptidase (prepilin peptidase)/N-methyltransferase